MSHFRMAVNILHRIPWKPAQISILSVNRIITIPIWLGYGYDVLFYGHEPQPAGNHYMYELLINNTLYTDTITEVNFASDEFVNGSFVRDYQVFRIHETDLKERDQLCHP